VKILLFIDHQPAQYKLSADLAKLLNIQYETRSRIIMGIWQYIKVNKLQDIHDKKTIVNNPQLKAVS
jgi:SWI/SNF-related matrix-associated actin-dependent regulator of chromatin subfamily D